MFLPQTHTDAKFAVHSAVTPIPLISHTAKWKKTASIGRRKERATKHRHDSQARTTRRTQQGRSDALSLAWREAAFGMLLAERTPFPASI